MPINGLVDTGADKTVLPIGYAQLLGYGANDLTFSPLQQVQGAADAWDVNAPSRAFVVGGLPDEFELRPLLVPGSLNVLWGRDDFMRAYAVVVSETTQQLTLVRT